MSDEQRRLNRTQSKFGAGNQNGSSRKKGNFEPFARNEGEHDGGKEHSVRKNKKQSSQKKRQSDAEAHTEKTPSPRKSYGSNVVEPNIKIEYQENSEGAVFSGLEDKPKIEEIRTAGWHTLSDTENGESRLYFEPDFMKQNVADDYFYMLKKKVNWFDKNIIINGVEYPQPRLVAWYGPLPYTYSGVTFEAKELPAPILEIKKAVEDVLKITKVNVVLNSVLLNLYRDGKDSVAWHCDDERSMGIQPTIASVSLGETRRFELRSKPMEMRSDAPPELVVYLQHGSLVVMDGVMQTDWQHRVPKEYHSKEPRINLTFRTVFPVEKVPRKPTSDYAEYKKPPFPKKTPPKPFQFKGEAFPALGETPDYPPEIRSKSRPQLKNTKMDGEGSSSTESIDKEIQFHDDGKTETEPNNPKHSSPVNHPSDEVQNHRTLKNSDKLQVCDTHAECSVANTDISMDTDSSPIGGTWQGKDVTDVPEFVPSNPPDSKGKSRHQNSPKNSNRSVNYHASSERSDWYERSGSCSSNQGRPKKSHKKSDRHDAPKCEPDDEEEIRRVWKIYDHIFENQAIFYKSYHQDEVNVLMTVVEHSENLPIHVVSIIADRLEIVTQKAENYYYNRQDNYRCQNRDNFRRYSSRNKGYNKRNE